LREYIGHECLKSSLAFRKPAVAAASRRSARADGPKVGLDGPASLGAGRPRACGHVLFKVLLNTAPIHTTAYKQLQPSQSSFVHCVLAGDTRLPHVSVALPMLTLKRVRINIL
jgi:hypothetical protein